MNFYSEGAKCLEAPWFIFGFPRHSRLLLCNRLVLSLFVFCGKKNKAKKYITKGVICCREDGNITGMILFFKFVILAY